MGFFILRWKKCWQTCWHVCLRLELIEFPTSIFNRKIGIDQVFDRKGRVKREKRRCRRQGGTCWSDVSWWVRGGKPWLSLARRRATLLLGQVSPVRTGGGAWDRLTAAGELNLARMGSAWSV